jgi:DNA-binding phage protein
VTALFKTKPEDHIRIMEIATMMKQSGLSNEFVSLAATMAQEYEGTFDLMVLWTESSDQEEKDEIIADIQEEIDQFEELPNKMVEKPYVSFDDLDEISKDVSKFKKALKREVDKRGGISELSRLSGIPQPSLSRFFNSASMPRRTTLYKIAKALKLPEKIIVLDWVA